MELLTLPALLLWQRELSQGQDLHSQIRRHSRQSPSDAGMCPKLWVPHSELFVPPPHLILTRVILPLLRRQPLAFQSQCALQPQSLPSSPAPKCTLFPDTLWEPPVLLDESGC